MAHGTYGIPHSTFHKERVAPQVLISAVCVQEHAAQYNRAIALLIDDWKKIFDRFTSQVERRT